MADDRVFEHLLAEGRQARGELVGQRVIGRAGLGQLKLLDPMVARTPLRGEGRVLSRLALHRVVLQEVHVLAGGGRPMRNTCSSAGTWSVAGVAFKDFAPLKLCRRVVSAPPSPAPIPYSLNLSLPPSL